jgi:hypothetical protein
MKGGQIDFEAAAAAGIWGVICKSSEEPMALPSEGRLFNKIKRVASFRTGKMPVETHIVFP